MLKVHNVHFGLLMIFLVFFSFRGFSQNWFSDKNITFQIGFGTAVASGPSLHYLDGEYYNKQLSVNNGFSPSGQYDEVYSNLNVFNEFVKLNLELNNKIELGIEAHTSFSGSNLSGNFEGGLNSYEDAKGIHEIYLSDIEPTSNELDYAVNDVEVEHMTNADGGTELQGENYNESVKGYTEISLTGDYYLGYMQNFGVYFGASLNYLRFQGNSRVYVYREYGNVLYYKDTETVDYSSFGAGLRFGVQMPLSRSIKWQILNVNYSVYFTPLFNETPESNVSGNKILNINTSVKILLHQGK